MRSLTIYAATTFVIDHAFSGGKIIHYLHLFRQQTSALQFL
jgi:hypothetical protein